MKLTDFLKGKKVNYKTDAGVIVQLEIKSVKEVHHSRDVGPSNAQNDWWPAQETWYTWDVEFTTGFKKSYDTIEAIDIIE